MTIDAGTAPRRLARPLALLVVALVAVSLAGMTARAALAGPKPRYLSSARSIELLRTAFGTVAERPFREPRIVVAPTSAATWALSDDVNMANRAWNPRTGRTWTSADAKAMWPEGMGGFTDPVTGDVYINAELAVESAMPHEVLHANASPEFLQAVGVNLNEGITEKLALDAMAAAGVRAEKVPAYASQRAVAEVVERMTGRDLLLRAYFNGGQHLTDFAAALGAGTLARVKSATAGPDMAMALRILETAQAPAAEKEAGVDASPGVEEGATEERGRWNGAS